MVSTAKDIGKAIKDIKDTTFDVDQENITGRILSEEDKERAKKIWSDYSGTVKKSNEEIATSTKEASDESILSTKKASDATSQFSAQTKISTKSASDSVKAMGATVADEATKITTTTSATTMAINTQMGMTKLSIADTMNSVAPAAQNAWSSVQDTFNEAPKYFSNTFGQAWNEVQKTFQVGGDLERGLAIGVNMTVTSSINRMVDAINESALVPLIKLGNAMDVIRGINLGGLTPFAHLPKFNFFKIPKLAQGAVLPPNQPFLSVVGDQKSGTNIEAPLDTIKQAVAEVLNENQDLLVAGFEAVVQAIQDKRMDVIIGDRVIGEAANRYNANQQRVMGV